MAISNEPRLRVRQMVPVFQLMSTDGHPVSIWDFKDKRNMVIVFLPGDECLPCMDFLQSASAMYHRYESENAVILAILQGEQHQAAEVRDQLETPFPILSDPTGRVVQRYTDTLPAVFVVDRYGELKDEWIATLPTQKQVLDAVELINLECPE